MELQTQVMNNVSVVELPGRLVMANAGAVRDAIASQLAQQSARVVLDLGKVEFVDSSGLSVLVSVLKNARAQGGDAVLLQPSQQVVALMMLTRLHEVFAIFQDQEAAVASLEAGAEAAA